MQVRPDKQKVEGRLAEQGILGTCSKEEHYIQFADKFSRHLKKSVNFCKHCTKLSMPYQNDISSKTIYQLSLMCQNSAKVSRNRKIASSLSLFCLPEHWSPLTHFHDISMISDIFLFKSKAALFVQTRLYLPQISICWSFLPLFFFNFSTNKN